MTLRRALQSLAAIVAVAALAFVQAKAAHAAFHLVQIREVFPGTVAKPGAEYIELQMWASGQNLIKDHAVRVFDGDGRPVLGGSDLSFPANVPNGANQSTFILATPEAETLFRFKADAPMSDKLVEDGGAVCWGPELDCVSWGRFPANTALTSPAGTPAGAIPDGMALQRSIASGCPTLLESGDDHNNSATDFVFAPPSPRPNAVPPTERECAVAAAPSAPKTSLRKKPAKRTRDHTPTFRFASDQAGSTFQCKVDRKPFRTCHSPYTTKPLKPGKHTFRVRASNASGAVDASPASFTFTILGRR